MRQNALSWSTVILGLSIGACQTDKTSAAIDLHECGGSTGLVIATPLALDETAVQAGQTLTGTVTYRNCSPAPISPEQIGIAGRPPGGTHGGGPHDDLTPMKGATTIAAGGTVTVTASRSFTASDPAGVWTSFATYRDASGAWHDGPDVSFTVVATGACGQATGLVVSGPLSLDKTAVQAAETLTGTVTYQNCSSAPISLEQIVIAGRPPGGTHAGGPFDDLTPAKGATTIARGGTVTVIASRNFIASDPPGAWTSFATYQDASGTWHDGPDVSFTVTQSSVASSVPTKPIAFTKDSPFTIDSGTTNYVYVPTAYDSTHQTPMTLFVWLHGCGGLSSGDIWTVSPGGSQNWISLTVGGAEGSCWNVSTDSAKVLAAIADLKTHFNLKPKGVILGGYSSGGDLTYRTAFYNANTFAGVLVENSSPFRDTGSSQSASLAAASWKFNVVHLAHLQDTTYPIDGARTETDAVKAAGYPMTRIEVDGGHYDNAGAIENGHAVPGTSADLATYLFPYLNAGWTSP